MAMVGLVDAELIFNGDGRACRCGANCKLEPLLID
jgi:hypothetical protein